MNAIGRLFVWVGVQIIKAVVCIVFPFVFIGAGLYWFFLDQGYKKVWERIRWP